MRLFSQVEISRKIISTKISGTLFHLWPVQILLLTRATEELEAEKAAREEEKVRYLGEKLPPLQITGLNDEEIQVRATDKQSEKVKRRRLWS